MQHLLSVATRQARHRRGRDRLYARREPPHTTMRVCPKCGYVEPPEWRHSRYSYWLDICKLGDFEKLHPKLATTLKHQDFAEDEDYVYRLMGKSKLTVERKAKIDFMTWREPMEHAEHKGPIHDFLKLWNSFHPNQRKLTEHIES